jgi:N-methylhydantoinase A
MRYTGQSYELTIPVGDTDLRGLKRISEVLQAFHTAHRQRFSYASEGEPVEIVNVRLKAVGRTAKPQFAERPLDGLDPRKAHSGYKPVYFADPGAPQAARPLLAALYERERLAPGNVVVGPAILFQLDTTTAIPPGWAATVDGWGNLVAKRWQATAGDRRESRNASGVDER